MIAGAAELPAAPGRLRAALAGALAAALLLAVWLPLHPARPLQPTADVTTHLSVARHLLRGEGYRTDVAYPLSFAFEFARELPQRLIHRQPGFATVLTLPVALAGGDPARAIVLARGLQVLLLGLLAALGAFALVRGGRGAGVLPWLILLGANPLLAFAVDWIFVELAGGLVLLALWLRSRDRRGPGPLDGVLAGGLVLLRLDLAWVPFLWWILAGGARRGRIRALGLAVLACLVVLAPWMVRTWSVTGRPVFSLQAYAELVKDTRAWPLYTVYRQLEPQPLVESLVRDPVPVARKAARGVKFFFRALPRFAPLPLLLVFGLALLGAVARPGTAAPVAPRAGPAARAGLTLLLLIVQYAFFDHSLRHLLVLLPVLAWEGAAFLAEALPGGRGLAPAVAAGIMVAVLPCRLPGWESAAREAVAAVPGTAEQVERFRDSKDAVLFVPHGMVPWMIDRPGVWNPGDEQVRRTIRRLLAQGDAAP